MQPTHSPTFAPTFSDEVPSTLVLGMGAGTFAIIVLSVALFVIWTLSMTCDLPIKIAWRSLSTILYAAVFLTLVFSPRESQHNTIDTDSTQVHTQYSTPSQLTQERRFTMIP